jgi:phosphatidylinositol alpha-1,6-mannosyltransferase
MHRLVGDLVTVHSLTDTHHPSATSVVADTTEPVQTLSVMVLLPQAFTRAGGVQTYGKILVKACCELSENGSIRPSILIRGDLAEDVDARYLHHSRRPLTFGGSRLRFALAAVRAVVRDRPDLLIAGHVNFGSLVLLLKALSPRMQVWFIAYGVDFWVNLPWPRRLAVRNAERVVAISEFTGNAGALANDVDLRRIAILPCAVDPLWTAEHESDSRRTDVKQRVLLTVARLARSESDKGIETVLHALVKVRAKLPDIRYVVVGDGDDRSRLMDLSRSLGIEQHVDFRGHVTADELAHAYSECAVFVMPSRKEGFGIVYLEAAFFGKPSIAASEAGAREVVTTATGRTVDFGDINGLASVLVQLLANPDELVALGKAARKRMLENFSYESFRDRLLTLLHTSRRNASARRK